MKFTKAGWVASVVPVIHGSDGTRIYGIDADDSYFYDSRGRFTGALRGN